MINVELILYDNELDVELEQTQEIEVEIQIGSSTIMPMPKYEGPYEVTPTINEQILLTKDKAMEDDLEVKSIPYQEVSNPQGGKTVIIAFT